MSLLRRRRVPGLVLLAALLPAVLVATLAAMPSAGASHRPRHGSDHGQGASVSVTDVTIRVPHQSPVQAWVVEPAGHLRRHSAAGVLWLHWLGSLHNDRSEFLAQAVALAGQGVVSVLPQGYFPWVPNPDGTTGDVTLVRNQVAAFKSALDQLSGNDAVDPHRIAVVGHDYGAMYGALLADQDHRVSVLALQAADSRWGDWFATYWLQLEGQPRADYYALFRGLDPVDHVARLGSHVLFQWAGKDDYIPEAVRQEMTAANPAAQSILYPNADHQLTDQAGTDLVAFLTAQLHLPS